MTQWIQVNGIQPAAAWFLEVGVTVLDAPEPNIESSLLICCHRASVTRRSGHRYRYRLRQPPNLPTRVNLHIQEGEVTQDGACTRTGT